MFVCLFHFGSLSAFDCPKPPLPLDVAAKELFDEKACVYPAYRILIQLVLGTH